MDYIPKRILTQYQAGNKVNLNKTTYPRRKIGIRRVGRGGARE